METALTCMYLQPNTQKASAEVGSQKFEEVWKGPWSEVKKALDPRNSTVFGVKILPGIERPKAFDTDTTNWKHEFSPVPVSIVNDNIAWVIDNFEVEELVAGELGQLTIHYVGTGVSTGQGETDNFIQPKPTTWSLHWGSEQRSVLAYCDDSTGQRADQIIKCKENPHPTVDELKANGYPDATEEDAKYDYWAGTTDIYRSIDRVLDNNNQGGRKIYDYYVKDVQPIFHYPIVERTQHIKELPSQLSADPSTLKPKELSAVELVDYKVASLTQFGCPFPLSGWEWLCVEDNYDGTYDGGAFTYQRNTIWWGAKKVDENFYGDSNTRWEPYSPPETEPGNGNS